MTTRGLLNKVLRGLRQFSLIIGDATTTVSDHYLLMLLQFVNEAKEEVEEVGWPWMALRQTVTVTLSNGVAAYDLVLGEEEDGPADVDTNDRSQLLYEQVTVDGGSESFRNSDGSLPQVWDVTSSTESRLMETTQEQMERWHMTDNAETGAPIYFAVWHATANLKLKIWPTPNGTYTLKMRLFIPQAELASDDLDTILSIPSRPIYLKALLKANAERGEELSAPNGALARDFTDALANATGREMTKQDSTVYLEL